MVLCCGCVYVWPEVICTFLSFSAHSDPLPTLDSEIYWMVLCCVCVYVWPELTYFSPCLLPPLPTLVGEFYWMVYVWTEVTCFLFLSAPSIANIRGWVLMNGLVLCMCVCCRSNLFLSLFAPSIANIRRWALMNGLMLCTCMCVCLTRSDLFFSLFVPSIVKNQGVSFTEYSASLVIWILIIWTLIIWTFVIPTHKSL